MPRGIFISKKQLDQSDWLLRSPLISLLLNHLQKQGRKTIASKVLYKAFDMIKTLTNKDPLRIFEAAIQTARPEFSVITTRRGRRSIYYYPCRLRSYKGISLCLRWIAISTRKRNGHYMSRKLAREIIATAQNSSRTIRKRRALYKLVKEHIFRHWKKRKNRKNKRKKPFR